MFESIKLKLSNAIHEGIVISESLQQQYRQRVSSRGNSQSSKATKSSTTTSIGVLYESISSSKNNLHFLGNQLTDGVSSQINVFASCNLLSNYEDDWQQIHDANKENVGHALVVAEKIDDILQRASEQKEIINKLNSCLAGVPALVIKLKESAETLQSLEQIGAKLELDLEKFENFCEEFELHEFKLAHQLQLAKNKQTKLNKLEQYRKQIAEQHQQKIRTYEHQLQQFQKERQAVFDSAFREDLEEYKKHGQLTIKKVSKTNKLGLEEVVLEQNDLEAKDALEQFLNG